MKSDAQKSQQPQTGEAQAAGYQGLVALPSQQKTPGPLAVMCLGGVRLAAIHASGAL